MKKVLFLSPHAGIWPHALPESYLARYLDGPDFEVTRISCDGTFGAHCTVMEARGVEFDASKRKKRATCRDCRRNAELLRPAYSGRDHRLSSVLTADDMARARQTVAAMDAEALEGYELLGVKVARLAAYETLLKFKKTAWVFDAAELAHLKTYVTNATLSLLAFSRLHAQLQPDMVVCYSPQYGVNGVCARFCELKGTQVYTIAGSTNVDERYRALMVWDWSAFGLTNPALHYWPQSDAYDVSPDDLARAQRHTDRLLEGTSFSVYSEPQSGRFDLRAHYAIPRDSRVVLAAMSSYDEVYSAYVIDRLPSERYCSDVFVDQVEWIASSIPFFAAHPELFFIIRVHPRTYPNKRERVKATGQERLAAVFADLPPNVRVNYPSDKISIYDLYGQIDALVTGWSTTGVEAMSHGVPVVTYDRNLPWYPASIHHTGRTRDEYFANLLQAARQGRSDRVAEAAHRWMAFSMSLGVVRHPSRFAEEALVVRHQALELGLKVVDRLAPGLVKRLEAARRGEIGEDGARFRRLLLQGARTLYEIPRAGSREVRL